MNKRTKGNTMKRAQYYVWQYKQAIKCNQDVLQEPDAVIKLNSRDNAVYNKIISRDDDFALEVYTRYLKHKYDLGGGISIAPVQTQQELCLEIEGGEQGLIKFQNEVSLKETYGVEPNTTQH